MNENDLRHKETRAVFPQFLEALGTKLSVEMVRMQSDQEDSKLEEQYHTLLDAQDTSYLSTRLLVRPERRVDLQASSCFLAESCIFSLVVLWYPKSSLSDVSLKGFFFELWILDKRAHSTHKIVTLANVLESTQAVVGLFQNNPCQRSCAFLQALVPTHLFPDTDAKSLLSPSGKRSAQEHLGS